jgi:hypothetical protein
MTLKREMLVIRSIQRHKKMTPPSLFYDAQKSIETMKKKKPQITQITQIGKLGDGGGGVLGEWIVALRADKCLRQKILNLNLNFNLFPFV